MKKLVLLGATGSIGTQTVNVVLQHPDQFEIEAVSAGHNIEGLKSILKKITVKAVSVIDEKDAEILSKEYPGIEFYAGEEGLIKLAEWNDYTLLVNALVGFAGFMPTLKAIQSGHDVALANKETLVVGGVLINAALKKYNCHLYPIDSEHSAIFQALQGNDKEAVRRLLITCSGGAFRNKTREELQNVTLKDALAHPNWSMGAKITVDCANLMNKGFEVTEAHWLFDVDYDHIEVLMHPESVVHSAVEYVDNSVIAQMGVPDMRLPIQYALTAPKRYPLDLGGRLDLAQIGTLHFSAPDYERWPLLALAYEAGKKGGNLDAVMNAANEVANAAFRKGKIPFLLIEETVIAAVRAVPFAEVKEVEDLLKANEWGRNYALEYIRSKVGFDEHFD